MRMHLDKALNIHPEMLQLRTERTRILASNIANESTPGYQARDIDFGSVLASAHADFILDGAANELLYRVPYSPSQDGNTVELGVEQAEFAQNNSEFQTSLAFLKMKIRDLAKVITG